MRDPLSWATSVLLQDLKKGRFRCGPRYLDLSKALQSFYSRLSVTPKRISISFRTYAPWSEDEGGAVSDFLRFAGLEPAQLAIPKANVNPSISPEAGLLVAYAAENLVNFSSLDKRRRISAILDFSKFIQTIDQELGPFTPNLQQEFVSTIRIRNRGMLEWLSLDDRPNTWVEPEPASHSIGVLGQYGSLPASKLVPQVFKLDGERLESLRSSIASSKPHRIPGLGTLGDPNGSKY